MSAPSSEAARLMALVANKIGLAAVCARIQTPEEVVRAILAGRRVPGAALKTRIAAALSIAVRLWTAPAAGPANHPPALSRAPDRGEPASPAVPSGLLETEALEPAAWLDAYSSVAEGAVYGASDLGIHGHREDPVYGNEGGRRW